MLIIDSSTFALVLQPFCVVKQIEHKMKMNEIEKVEGVVLHQGIDNLGEVYVVFMDKKIKNY